MSKNSFERSFIGLFGARLSMQIWEFAGKVDFWKKHSIKAWLVYCPAKQLHWQIRWPDPLFPIGWQLLPVPLGTLFWSVYFPRVYQLAIYSIDPWHLSDLSSPLPNRFRVYFAYIGFQRLFLWTNQNSEHRFKNQPYRDHFLSLFSVLKWTEHFRIVSTLYKQPV